MEKPHSAGQDSLLYPAKRKQPLRGDSDAEKAPLSLPPSPKPATSVRGSVVVMPEDFKEKVAELLGRYASGLWASALPKAYEDAYKVKFPEEALNNLALLVDICTVDYISGNPQKAILYAKLPTPANKTPNEAGQAQGNYDIKTMIEQEYLQIEENIAKSAEGCMEDVKVPPLVIPTEASPSVLVVELSNTNEVVIRQAAFFFSNSWGTVLGDSAGELKKEG